MGRLLRQSGEQSAVTVVFVHGFCLNLDCWHFQRAAYRGRVRAVYYDQRSHGRSARSAEEHSTIEQLGKDLMRVIETTSPGSCVVVGHSMGGMSIISLAEHHPELFGDKVLGTALISTTAGGLDPGRILFPMLPLGLGGSVTGRVVRTLDRGHLVVDKARAWGRILADVVTDRIERRIVHLLVAAFPLSEQDHAARSKWNPSAARPGPKAIAIPFRTSGRSISSDNTNIRVEEDMLPNRASTSREANNAP